jgi:hypothetical protein
MGLCEVLEAVGKRDCHVHARLLLSVDVNRAVGSDAVVTATLGGAAVPVRAVSPGVFSFATPAGASYFVSAP